MKVPKTAAERNPFFATLKLVGTHRGRSAARFLLEDANGEEYSMSMSALFDALQLNGASPGQPYPQITGTWGWRKQGTAWTLWPLGAEEES